MRSLTMGAVNIERCTAYPSSFQPCPSHPRLNALDDEGPLQLRNRSNDYDHRTTQRPASVDVLAEADELNAYMT